MRIGSVSGIAGRGDSSLIRPVPDAETLPYQTWLFLIDHWSLYAIQIQTTPVIITSNCLKGKIHVINLRIKLNIDIWVLPASFGTF